MTNTNVRFLCIGVHYALVYIDSLNKFGKRFFKDLVSYDRVCILSVFLNEVHFC